MQRKANLSKLDNTARVAVTRPGMEMIGAYDEVTSHAKHGEAESVNIDFASI